MSFTGRHVVLWLPVLQALLGSELLAALCCYGLHTLAANASVLEGWA